MIDLDEWYRALPPKEAKRWSDLRAQRDEFRSKADEIDAHLREFAARHGVPELDGVTSPQSGRLRQQFNAGRFNLSPWWAATNPDWCCPACSRGKPDIVRTEGGALWGHIVAHHDHFRDGLEELMCERSRLRGKVPADAAARDFVSRFEKGLARFNDVLICGDCNNADAAAKKIVVAPAHFSFSPAEIRQVCDVAPNRPHRVDPDRTREVYARAVRPFELRREAAVRLIDKALHGEHWYEVTDFKCDPDRVSADAARAAAIWGGGIDMRVLADASCKSKTFDTWRRRRHAPPLSGPDDADIAFLASKKHASWSNCGVDWRCPCCQRDKRATVSKTNAGKWQFKPDTATLADGRFTVCHDCFQTFRDFRKEVEQACGLPSTDYVVIGLDEFRSLIRPQAHTRHNIDSPAVDRLLSAFAERFSGE